MPVIFPQFGPLFLWSQKNSECGVRGRGGRGISWIRSRGRRWRSPRACLPRPWLRWLLQQLCRVALQRTCGDHLKLAPIFLRILQPTFKHHLTNHHPPSTKHGHLTPRDGHYQGPSTRYPPLTPPRDPISCICQGRLRWCARQRQVCLTRNPGAIGDGLKRDMGGVSLVIGFGWVMVGYGLVMVG